MRMWWRSVISEERQGWGYWGENRPLSPRPRFGKLCWEIFLAFDHQFLRAEGRDGGVDVTAYHALLKRREWERYIWKRVRTLTVEGDVQVFALAGESWFGGGGSSVQFATRSRPASLRRCS